MKKEDWLKKGWLAMKNIVTFVMICVMLLSLNSCGKPPDTNVADSVYDVYTQQFQQLTAAKVAVYTGSEPTAEMEQNLQRLNMAIAKTSLPLQFEYFYAPFTGSDTNNTKLREQLSTCLDKGYIVAGQSSILYAAAQTLPLQDLTAYQGVASQYFSDTYIHDPVIIPISLQGIDGYNNMAALVRKELYAEYNKPISTATEYEQFLDWITKSKPGMHPVLFTALSQWNRSISVMYDLFLPEYGYINVDDFRAGASVCVSLDDGKFYATEDIPELPQILERAKQWREKYDMLVNQSQYAVEDCASIYVYLPYAVSGQPIYVNTSNESSSEINPADYQLCVLYPNDLPYNAYKPHQIGVIANQNVDAEAFFHFIERMYTDIEFYKLVKYGELGVDYVESNGEYEYIEGGIYSEQYPGDSTWLTNLKFEGKIKNHYADNAQNVINSMTFTSLPQYDKAMQLAYQMHTFGDLDSGSSVDMRVQMEVLMQRSTAFTNILVKIMTKESNDDIIGAYNTMLEADMFISMLNEP